MKLHTSFYHNRSLLFSSSVRRKKKTTQGLRPGNCGDFFRRSAGTFQPTMLDELDYEKPRSAQFKDGGFHVDPFH